MLTEPVIRLREGLNEGRFTMTEIAKISGIPLMTLSDMKDENWRPKIFDRLERLQAALDEVDGKPAEQSDDQGRAPTAA